MTGLEMIAQERAEQAEGMDSEDHKWINGELAFAAAAYLLRGRGIQPISMYWPFRDAKWNPSPNNRRRELAMAGALVAAEIDRLNQLEKDNADKGNAPATT